MFFDIDKVKAPGGKTFKEDPVGVVQTVLKELHQVGRKHPNIVAGLSAVTNQENWEHLRSANPDGPITSNAAGYNQLVIEGIQIGWSANCPTRSIMFISRPANGCIDFPAIICPESTYYPAMDAKE